MGSPSEPGAAGGRRTVGAPASTAEWAGAVLDLTLARPATLGAGRLVCVDGPSGSGKTTLAAAVAGLAPDATLVHTDELIEGWGGLPGLAGAVGTLLGPLARGEAGRWRRWDWHAGAWAEWREVEPGGLLVLDGVGSWSPGISSLVTALVWVEAPREVRMRRGLDRDGDDFAPYWARWSRDEAALFARDGTREHADVMIET